MPAARGHTHFGRAASTSACPGTTVGCTMPLMRHWGARRGAQDRERCLYRPEILRRACCCLRSQPGMSQGNLAAAGGGVAAFLPPRLLGSPPWLLLLPARLSGGHGAPFGLGARPAHPAACLAVGRRGDLAGFVSLRRCDFRANPACSVFPNPHLEGRSSIRIRVLPTHPVPCHLPSSPASPGALGGSGRRCLC